ncbi:MAG: hypothetical protein COV09_00845 [Candidatus Vogelbacteria bacterium CG10_big_fil_rev_8_21_14_0_10_50_13]|uniref:Type II toxin-antitoxin system HicA family toxin n=1 Tax=Candidatus Vogelbacteria bacterium CG10_big_fil_rev_8_21_14_0_10_50_13 TaxID=1975044 RepID=A0A2H0RGD4_9BACT|nr:MAG: hypothetical protein COV09_00845 [Candidatus Vogelbacteria bacterium CG10_big_fil_rev_8_21_14_0_10_50_13]
MPNRLNNWAYRDVESFLKDNGFRLNHIRGSHYYFVGHIDGKHRQVCVPYHSRNAFKPRTLKGVILQSGIKKEKWLD